MDSMLFFKSINESLNIMIPVVIMSILLTVFPIFSFDGIKISIGSNIFSSIDFPIVSIALELSISAKFSFNEINSSQDSFIELM